MLIVYEHRDGTKLHQVRQSGGRYVFSSTDPEDDFFARTFAEMHQALNEHQERLAEQRKRIDQLRRALDEAWYMAGLDR